MTIRREATQVVIQSNGVDAMIAKETGVLAAGAVGVSGNDVCTMGQSKLVSATAQATTSGTSIDFTGIPSWAKRITVMLNGVSTNGTSVPQIQLGTSGGVESTGYTTATSNLSTVVVSGQLASGFGLCASAGTAAITYFGKVTFDLLSANLWVGSGVLGMGSGAQTETIGGSKTLSGTLDRIRLTTVNGTDTFDAGSVNLIWE